MDGDREFYLLDNNVVNAVVYYYQWDKKDTIAVTTEYLLDRIDWPDGDPWQWESEGLFICLTDISLIQNKQFLPRETLVYIRLVEYTLQALDIYTINVSQMGQTFIRSPA